MKKLLCLLMTLVFVATLFPFGTFSVGAYEKTVGGYAALGEYTPSSPNINTQRLMFAMPDSWQNDITKDPRCGGAAGIYWWMGYDTPDAVADGHGWPGYKAQKVNETGVGNLFAVDVPTYGNGDAGNANMIIWNNYINSGTETDTTRNPFYSAARQTRDYLAAPLSRFDKSKIYDPVFRYAYKKIFTDAGIDGAEDLNLNSNTFWVDINKISAVYLGNDWGKLSADEKECQSLDVLDEIQDNGGFDLSEFGDYADNFFNEDYIDEIYPAEEPQYYGLSFTYDNMVFVVNFDPDKMIPDPTGLIGFDGNFFFYYGGGEYGSWPTKELNEKMGGVSGNFATGDVPLPILVGDVSMDGAITVADVTIIQQALAEFKPLTNEQIAAADVDGNGTVTVADATRLQMYLAEFDVELG